jgi:sulfur-oxidizing protein SoxB
MTLAGKPIDANRRYKVASWAPVGEGASGPAIWDVMAAYLRERKVVSPRALNRPRLIGVGDDPGVSDASS